jgi:hypothetical protein
MKQRIAGIVVFLVVAGIVAGIAWQRRESPAARQDRMVRAFIAVLPDSLDSEHRLEIEQLFHMFYMRAGRGEVAKEDVERITADLTRHTAQGRISSTDLVHFMADVGYTTYKGDPHYNLPDKSVDHPVLNPESGVYPLRFDSTQYDSAFWADFEKWRKEHPELTDSMYLEELPLPQE